MTSFHVIHMMIKSIKILFPLLCFAFKAISVNAQYTLIPDTAFEKALITKNIDSGPVDGKILTSKISGITHLHLTDTSITDLTGIEDFINLEEIYMSRTKVTNLDFSSNIKLKKIRAHNNRIAQVDLTQNIELNYLQLLGNQLTSIDLTNNILLETLDLVWNKLDTLILTKNINLKSVEVSNNKLVHLVLPGTGSKVDRLICGINKLRTIDLSQQQNLEIFSIQHTPLDSLNLTKNTLLKTVTTSYCYISELDVSKNPDLIQLGCHNSQIKSIDLSQNGKLKRAYLMNNDLRAIYAKNGSNEELHVGGNDSLSFVCVDFGQLARARHMIDSVGLTSCDMGTSCSYPLKNSTARVLFRSWLANSAGKCESGRTPYPYLKYSLESNGEKSYYITNNQGVGQFFVEDKAYEVLPIYNKLILNCTPNALAVDFRRSSQIKKKEFCLSYKSSVLDVGVNLIPTASLRPGLTGSYRLIYFNNGSQTVDGQVSLLFPDSVLQFLFADVTPDEIKNNLLIWNYENLKPFEKRSIALSFRANRPTDSIPLDGGDWLCFKSKITPLKLDTLKENNETILKQRVVNSWDPNDIRCLQGPSVSSQYIGKFVEYMIRFENTGSAEALQIRIENRIPLDNFDVSSVSILDASHTCQARLTDKNKLEFIFENINLSHIDSINKGYVVYRIRLLPSMNPGDTFNNMASIFFDYNYPITTNKEKTPILLETSSLINVNQVDFSIYPNPTTGFLHIKSFKTIDQIQIFDAFGNLVSEPNIHHKAINLTGLSKGMYFLKATIEGQNYTKRFVLQ